MSDEGHKSENGLVRRNALVIALREKMPVLEELLVKMHDHWVGEDGIYRYYHTSFKVYHLQDATVKIVSVLQSIIPGQVMDELFTTIIKEGTGCKFTTKSNQRWMKETRPIIEAFFHALYFLEMAVKYGKKQELVEDVNPKTFEERLRVPPLPSGMAALLTLFGLLHYRSTE